MSYINEIRKLRSSKLSDDKIRKVMDVMSGSYRMSSLLEIIMEYYTLCEMITESLNPELEDAKEELAVINEVTGLLAEGKSIAEHADRLADTRRIITRKMDCVTAYVDCFLIYEYVLERLAPLYIMSENELKDTVNRFDKNEYTGELLKYIFSTNDNTEITERLCEVLECLPVRMSRKKYYSMLEKGLELYEDSDKASFDEYIYMIRMSAMLFEYDDPEGLFEDYRLFAEELKEAPYATLTEDHFRILTDKLSNVTVNLGNVSDVYMCLQKIVNMLYVYAVNEDAEAPEGYGEFADTGLVIVKKLHDVIMDDSLSNDMPESELTGLEGFMEELLDIRNALRPALEEFEFECMNRIEELGLSDMYKKLEASDRLFRGLFAELQAADTEMVTDEYWQERSKALMSDMEDLIKNSSRYVTRAIINNTFCKLPLPFRTSDDIRDYILNAFEHCGDNAELCACMQSMDSLIMM